MDERWRGQAGVGVVRAGVGDIDVQRGAAHQVREEVKRIVSGLLEEALWGCDDLRACQISAIPERARVRTGEMTLTDLR